MDESPDGEARRPAPSDWQGWERWTEGVDWSDWRSWLRRLAATDWAAPGPGEVPWETPTAGSTALTLSAYQEDFPGPRMREQLAGIWPAFHRWWSQGRVHARPTAAEARARLEEHMPQLVGTWEQLVAMLPGDPDAGPALSFSLTFGGGREVGEGFGIPIVVRYVLEV